MVTKINHDVITIVSGLPRSGTSMIMRMLEAGGMPLVVDNIRKPDRDNPRGYYEYERVKRIKDGDVFWLRDCRGKAVKIVSLLLEYLPPDNEYKVIFMRREMEEILASQKQMLVRRGEPTDTISDQKLAGLFDRHVAQVEAWLAEQPNIDTLYVSYNEIVEDPETQVRQVDQFLGGGLDTEAMAAAVDPALHRQRA